MNRADWEFPYTADKLLDAAKEKFDHHTARLTWWTDKKAATAQKLKTEGVQIDESVAETASKLYSNTGRQASVTMDNGLIRDFQECVNKMDEHRGKVAEYDAWMQVLSSQTQATLQLDQNDWLFFFGKRS